MCMGNDIKCVCECVDTYHGYDQKKKTEDLRIRKTQHTFLCFIHSHILFYNYHAPRTKTHTGKHPKITLKTLTIEFTVYRIDTYRHKS
jgi:hypothetical protein